MKYITKLDEDEGVHHLPHNIRHTTKGHTWEWVVILIITLLVIAAIVVVVLVPLLTHPPTYRIQSGTVSGRAAMTDNGQEHTFSTNVSGAHNVTPGQMQQHLSNVANSIAINNTRLVTLSWNANDGTVTMNLESGVAYAVIDHSAVLASIGFSGPIMLAHGNVLTSTAVTSRKGCPILTQGLHRAPSQPAQRNQNQN